jgi:hypothetical protein
MRGLIRGFNGKPRHARWKGRNFAPPSQLSLAGQEHGQTIPLADKSGALVTKSCYARYDLDGFGNPRCTYCHSAWSIQYRR